MVIFVTDVKTLRHRERMLTRDIVKGFDIGSARASKPDLAS